MKSKIKVKVKVEVEEGQIHAMTGIPLVPGAQIEIPEEYFSDQLFERVQTAEEEGVEGSSSTSTCLSSSTCSSPKGVI